MIKMYGFSKIGERVMAEKSGNRKDKRISVIAVRNHKHQLLHSFYFKGSTNKEVFKIYLAEILLPNLPKDSYLIMDNAAFHKGDEIENLIRSANINLIYLPTYSPDLNPIEKKWAQVKSYYRKLTHYFDDKMQLLDLVLTENKYARLI
jgi:transposase